MSRRSKNNSTKRSTKQSTHPLTLKTPIKEGLDNSFSKNVEKLNHSDYDNVYNHLKEIQKKNNEDLKYNCKKIKEYIGTADKNVYYEKLYKHYKTKIDEFENENTDKINYLKGILTYLEEQIKTISGDDRKLDDSNALKIIQSKYEYKRISDLIDELEQNLEK